MPLIRNSDSGGRLVPMMEYGDRGHTGPPDCPQKQLEEVHLIDIRDDDLVLCSYPKSGCHWLWEMTRLLLAGTAKTEVVEKEKFMMELMPRSTFTDLPSPRIFNTHFLFSELPKKVQEGKNKLLFVYRNPKDVAVSFYNHHYKFPKYEYQGTFHDHLEGLFFTGKVDYGGIFHYLKDWEAVLDSRPDLNVFIVSYEQLQADTFGRVKELAQFLGSSADEDTIRQIVEECSFSQMKERKGKQWLEMFGEAFMYRKGVVGDWKNWFTEAESQKMDSLCEKEMKGSRFTFQYELS